MIVDRIELTDGTARWFDRNRAIRFKAQIEFVNGHENEKGKPGWPWGEELFYTRKNSWILIGKNQTEDEKPTIGHIPEANAIAWLVRNQIHPEDIPEDLREKIKWKMMEMEI
jgi:hypothetical protein